MLLNKELIRGNVKIQVNKQPAASSIEHYSPKHLQSIANKPAKYEALRN